MSLFDKVVGKDGFFIIIFICLYVCMYVVLLYDHDCFMLMLIYIYVCIYVFLMLSRRVVMDHGCRGMISYAGEGHKSVSWSYCESSGKSSLEIFMR